MVKQGLNAFQASYFTNRYFFVQSMEIIKFIDANCYQNDISRHDDIIILEFSTILSFTNTFFREEWKQLNVKIALKLIHDRRKRFSFLGRFRRRRFSRGD